MATKASLQIREEAANKVMDEALEVISSVLGIEPLEPDYALARRGDREFRRVSELEAHAGTVALIAGRLITLLKTEALEDALGIDTPSSPEASEEKPKRRKPQ